MEKSEAGDIEIKLETWSAEKQKWYVGVGVGVGLGKKVVWVMVNDLVSSKLQLNLIKGT